ncbi:MAG: hypothetical protein GOV00_02440 [Candidatus Altiarchaeota archaeon]|nr:hypothetical protein [Candidatus Altiarchaeota archaeon]
MAERKKGTVGATVAPPDQNSDFLTQIQGTFERGVVSAEIDLGGLFAQEGQGGGSVKTLWGEASRITTGPAGAHEHLLKKMKEIANSFGGRFTTHAPMQADPSEIMSIGRARAANILKNSVKYSDKIGATVMTVHPIGSMQYYFIEPFTGQRMPVQSPFMLAKDKGELTQLFKQYNVKDNLLKDQIEKEWENFIQVLPTFFAEKYGPQAAQLFEDFSKITGQVNVVNLANRWGDDPEKIYSELRKNREHFNPRVYEAMEAEIMRMSSTNGQHLKDLRRSSKGLENYLDKELWPKVATTTLNPISKDGKIITRPLGFETLSKAEQEETLRKSHLDMAKQGWEAMLGRGRFGPFKDSIDQIEASVKDTFRRLLSDSEVKKTLKKGKLKLGIENLFPAAPEKGYMAGFAHFYKPKHMAKLVKDVRAIAKANGISEDAITLTFDVGHSAASGIKPTKFLKDLKKHGVKPGHVHLVGGPGYGEGHIAWGDWLDEVSRMDPGIISKLTDMGVVNIEGGAGLYDVEVTVNTMWNEGIPLEALMAMAGGPTPSMGDLRYTGFKAPPYWAQAAERFRGTGLAQRGFYSFSAETVGAPMMTAFGSYGMPGFTGGGYSIGPGTTSRIWSGAQPLLYSTKKKG